MAYQLGYSDLRLMGAGKNGTIPTRPEEACEPAGHRYRILDAFGFDGEWRELIRRRQTELVG